MAIRDWLDPRLRDWGAQRRRIITGRVRRRDGTVHEDGWPSISVAALPLDGGITGGSGHASQHFHEIYTPHALQIWRVFSNAPYEIRQIIHVHYVLIDDAGGAPLDIAAKAKMLQLSKASYFNQLNSAQHYFAGVLDSLDFKSPTNVPQPID